MTTVTDTNLWRLAAPSSFDGRFAVFEELWVDPNGASYAGKDQQNGQAVTLHVMPKALFDGDGDGGAQNRARVEAAARWSHPHLLPYRLLGETEHSVYVVCDHAQGQPLARWRREVGNLQVDDIYRIMGQLISVVKSVRTSGGVLGSINPTTIRIHMGNVIVTTPWYLARDGRNIDGLPPQRKSWLAPEQVEDDEVVPATDVFALGMILGYLLANGPPEAGHSLMIQGLDVLPAVDDVYVKSTGPQTGRRHTDVVAFAEHLRDAAGFRWDQAQKIVATNESLLAVPPATVPPPLTAAGIAAVAVPTVDMTEPAMAAIDPTVFDEVDLNVEMSEATAVELLQPEVLAIEEVDSAGPPSLPPTEAPPLDGVPPLPGLNRDRSKKRNVAPTGPLGSAAKKQESRSELDALSERTHGQDWAVGSMAMESAVRSGSSISNVALPTPGGPPPPLPPIEPEVAPGVPEILEVSAVFELAPLAATEAAMLVPHDFAKPPPMPSRQDGAGNVDSAVGISALASAPIDLAPPKTLPAAALQPEQLPSGAVGPAGTSAGPATPKPVKRTKTSNAMVALTTEVLTKEGVKKTTADDAVASKVAVTSVTAIGATAVKSISTPPAKANAAASNEEGGSWFWLAALLFLCAGGVAAYFLLSDDAADPASGVASTTSQVTPQVVAGADVSVAAAVRLDAGGPGSVAGAAIAAASAGDVTAARAKSDSAETVAAVSDTRIADTGPSVVASAKADTATGATTTTTGVGTTTTGVGTTTTGVGTTTTGVGTTTTGVGTTTTGVGTTTTGVGTTTTGVGTTTTGTVTSTGTIVGSTTTTVGTISTEGAAGQTAATFQPKKASDYSCPGGMARARRKVQVTLDSGERVKDNRYYCIDRYEYPGRGRKPRVNVTLDAAKSACASAGKRLCSRKEWRGGCGGKYPYGRTFKQERCNIVGEDGLPKSVVATGSKSGCKSGLGTYDMVGNVAEWTSEGNVNGGNAYKNGKNATCYRSSRRSGGSPYVGFRCCARARPR